MDFPFLNMTGFTFYSICYTVGYFFPDGDSNYGLGNVRIQDLVFAYHAAILTVLNGIQCIIYHVIKTIILLVICYNILEGGK